MSVDVERYLEMERAHYSELVARSNFSAETFTRVDSAEMVVGSYSQHEAFDYERWLLSGVAIGTSAVALEYGCGPGRMLLRLAPHFHRVDGADISPEVLDVARRRCARLPSPPELFLTDGQGLPDAVCERYDVAYSVICLQHICVYSIRRRILDALYRALKPGGLLVFQMGYGPGHAGMTDYFADFVEAAGTNGTADVGVLHPSEIGDDLASVGFESASFALTPTGPGDTHGAWIFVRAIKPGLSTAAIATLPGDWREHGFVAMTSDRTAGEKARRLHLDHGILGRVTRAEASEAASRAAQADLETRLLRLKTLEREQDALQDALAFAHADRDGWRSRAHALATERDRLLRRVEIDETQIARLRVADRRRLKAVVEELVREAAAGQWRVGVFGTGAHTEWLLRETPLAEIANLFFFDSDPARAGSVVAGWPIVALHEVPALGPQAVLVSSLAFQDEMTDAVRSLGLHGIRIVRCYP